MRFLVGYSTEKNHNRKKKIRPKQTNKQTNTQKKKTAWQEQHKATTQTEISF